MRLPNRNSYFLTGKCKICKQPYVFYVGNYNSMIVNCKCVSGVFAGLMNLSKVKKPLKYSDLTLFLSGNTVNNLVEKGFLERKDDLYFVTEKYWKWYSSLMEHIDKVKTFIRIGEEEILREV
jgi:hypothetical protein